MIALLSLALDAPTEAVVVDAPPPVVAVAIIVPPPPVAPPPMIKIVPPPPPPPQLPAASRALLDAAIASGDATAVATILRFVRQTSPEATAQTNALQASYEADVAEKKAIAARQRAEELANAAFLDNWKGEIELGGSRSTGNTRNIGLYGATRLEKEGLRWRHRLTGRADLQRSFGETTTERIVAAWQPNYKFDDQLYAYGLGQYEHDRFLGYANRYTAGAGAGYTVFNSPAFRLDVEGGPAIRHTDYVLEPQQTTLAARGSLNLRWRVAPTVNITNDASLFVEEGNANATTTLALDTKLSRALKVRLSYNVQYERDAPDGRNELDTLSRATLVIGL